ncbi:MAG: hypothetical protein QM699_06505 [Amaricoccus sp.]|uniref:hypothetical protein n=1 Tax=Amaricoccus sp. TaxID=1872485 RepID=UPI0039E43588
MPRAGTRPPLVTPGRRASCCGLRRPEFEHLAHEGDRQRDAARGHHRADEVDELAPARRQQRHGGRRQDLDLGDRDVALALQLATLVLELVEGLLLALGGGAETRKLVLEAVQPRQLRARLVKAGGVRRGFAVDRGELRLQRLDRPVDFARDRRLRLAQSAPGIEHLAIVLAVDLEQALELALLLLLRAAECGHRVAVDGLRGVGRAALRLQASKRRLRIGSLGGEPRLPRGQGGDRAGGVDARVVGHEARRVAERLHRGERRIAPVLLGFQLRLEPRLRLVHPVADPALARLEVDADQRVRDVRGELRVERAESDLDDVGRPAAAHLQAVVVVGDDRFHDVGLARRQGLGLALDPALRRVDPRREHRHRLQRRIELLQPVEMELLHHAHGDRPGEQALDLGVRVEHRGLAAGVGADRAGQRLLDQEPRLAVEGPLDRQDRRQRQRGQHGADDQDQPDPPAHQPERREQVELVLPELRGSGRRADHGSGELVEVCHTGTHSAAIVRAVSTRLA